MHHLLTSTTNIVIRTFQEYRHHFLNHCGSLSIRFATHARRKLKRRPFLQRRKKWVIQMSRIRHSPVVPCHIVAFQMSRIRHSPVVPCHIVAFGGSREAVSKLSCARKTNPVSVSRVYLMSRTLQQLSGMTFTSNESIMTQALSSVLMTGSQVPQYEWLTLCQPQPHATCTQD
jgi:hypothetical protein